MTEIEFKTEGVEKGDVLQVTDAGGKDGLYIFDDNGVGTKLTPAEVARFKLKGALRHLGEEIQEELREMGRKFMARWHAKRLAEWRENRRK